MNHMCKYKGCLSEVHYMRTVSKGLRGTMRYKTAIRSFRRLSFGGALFKHMTIYHNKMKVKMCRSDNFSKYIRMHSMYKLH